jgi:hypothetical protein
MCSRDMRALLSIALRCSDADVQSCMRHAAPIFRAEVHLQSGTARADTGAFSASDRGNPGGPGLAPARNVCATNVVPRNWHRLGDAINRVAMSRAGMSHRLGHADPATPVWASRGASAVVSEVSTVVLLGHVEECTATLDSTRRRTGPLSGLK